MCRQYLLISSILLRDVQQNVGHARNLPLLKAQRCHSECLPESLLRKGLQRSCLRLEEEPCLIR